MKILLCGCCGKMGREAVQAAKELGEEIVCGVDLSPCPLPFPVYSSFEGIKESPDLVIDFSSRERFSERLSFCLKRKIGIVLATTGFSAEDEELIQKASKSIPVLKSSNFSLGILVLKELLPIATRRLQNFEISIVERHHREKKDSPSGTALSLLSALEGSREAEVFSIRGGTLAGEHEVTFYGDGEVLTLSHSVRDRKIFALGAIKASALLLGAKPGLYGMSDLLFDPLQNIGKN